MATIKRENPFYSNHVFSELDLERTTFSRWNWVWLWLWPTYVQCSEGYAFFYKNVGGRIYLIKEERIGDSPKDTL